MSRMYNNQIYSATSVCGEPPRIEQLNTSKPPFKPGRPGKKGVFRLHLSKPNMKNIKFKKNNSQLQSLL